MSAINYGLIGHPVEHSLSPFIHKAILSAAVLPGDYRLYDINPDELARKLPPLFQRLNGFNCTIPHKEAVIPYLDSLDETAKRCLSVNTVYKNKGYNTDYMGFLADCPDLADTQVLILGAGGVSRTMAFAAVDSGAQVSILARRQDQAQKVAAAVEAQNPGCHICCPEDFSEWLNQIGEEKTEQSRTGKNRVLLNGTPLGLWPNTSGMPVTPEQIDYFDIVYDTIYNPVATRLVLQAKSRKIKAKSGLGMLFGQALAAQKIWNPELNVKNEDLIDIRSKLAAAVSKEFATVIILTGFMGSGKSTIGSKMAKSTGLPFIDLDQVIEAGERCTIPDIFARAGEKTFRAIEQKYLQKYLCCSKSLLLAAGGGTLLEPAAEGMVRSSAALVVYLDTPLEQIRERVGEGEGRPMIYRRGEQNIQQLYDKRRPIYLRQADLVTAGSDSPDNIIQSLLADLGFGGRLK